MHGKFLKYGSGSARRANEYVLGNIDNKGDQRHQVLLIQGNQEIFAAVADSLDFKSRYKSYVAGFAKEDDPTIEEINEFVDEFKKTAFAGLEPDEYVFYAALHVDEDGKKDLHILSANVHLKTGKALNIAPPNWQKTFDPLRDWFNNTKGWARPDDPARARAFQRGAWNLSEKESKKDQLHNYLMQCFDHGLINDRDDVINLISEIGTISRQGDNYISVKVEGEEKAFRLKGELYDRQFSAESWLEIARENGTGKISGVSNGSTREVITNEHRERASSARTTLDEKTELRAQYNKKRYKKKNENNIEMVLNDNARVIDFNTSNCIFIQPDKPQQNNNSSILRDKERGERETIQNIKNARLDDMHSWQRTKIMSGGIINDGTRNAIISELESINERIRKTSADMAESISRFEESKRRFDGVIGAVRSGIQHFIETTRQYLGISSSEEVNQLFEEAKPMQPEPVRAPIVQVDEEPNNSRQFTP